MTANAPNSEIFCFWFGPAPEEKPYYLMYASMNNQGE